ncbi:MAG: hypothetical protein IPJ81_01500 [Chitinophagaceae bacterium]|nr:hypothetical protein [Chitinophagaceae bacterium]
MNKLLLLTLFNLISVLGFSQQTTNYEKIETIPKISAYAFLPDIHIMEDSLTIDSSSGSIKTFGAEHNSQIFDTNEKYLEFLKRLMIYFGYGYEIQKQIKDFVTITFLINPEGYLDYRYPRLIKAIEYQPINLEIIRVFKKLRKIVPPTDKTKKNVWTLVTCRIYFDISPIPPRKKIEPTLQKISSQAGPCG